MTTSAYMPDVVVEIAFNSGWSTLPASRTWTDVSAYVDLDQNISIGFGRSDELATADANSLSLTLDNRDGRFTPLRAASPYYPNVRIGRPIRVTATPVGGSASVRFVGYIDEWPLSWDGSDGYARVTITATSRMARLGQLASLRSVIEEETLSNHPTLYYPLGEPQDSRTAADVSGNDGPNLRLTNGSNGPGFPLSFGAVAGPTTDSINAPQFNGGQVLTTAMNYAVNTATGDIWVGFAFSTTTTLDSGLLALYNDAGPLFTTIIEFGISTTGYVSCVAGASTTVTSAQPYNDGNTHSVFVRLTATNAFLYIDGVIADTSAAAPGLSGSFTRLVVGDLTGYGRPLIGSISHVAIGLTPLSAGQVNEIARSIRTGFTGESSVSRLQRVAKWLGIPASELVADASTTSIAAFDTTGTSGIDVMQKIVSAEDGVLFDRRDGLLEFHNRTHRYTPTAALTLNMAAQEVEADYAPMLDRSTLVNDVVASNVDGTITARAFDRASSEEYGNSSSSIETVSDVPLAVSSTAAWRLLIYKEPRPRVPSLSIDALALVPVARMAALLAATVGTYVSVVNRPSQAESSTAAYFVEGVTETIAPESYTFTLNVSPGFPYDSLFVIGSSLIDGPDLIAI